MFGLAFTKCNLFFSRNHCNTSQCPMHLSTAKQHMHSTSHPHKSLLSCVGQSKVIAQVYSTLQASFSNRQCFYFLKRLGKRIFRSQFFSSWKDSNAANPLMVGNVTCHQEKARHEMTPWRWNLLQSGRRAPGEWYCLRRLLTAWHPIQLPGLLTFHTHAHSWQFTAGLTKERDLK